MAENKTFKETAVGKFLSSKGFDSILSAVGMFVPQVAVLKGVKDAVLGTPQYANLPQEDKETFLKLHQQDLDAAQEAEDSRLQDVANARAREIEIAKSTKKDWMMWVTGLVGLIAFGFTIYAVTYITIPSNNEKLFDILIGNVMGVAISIFTYYFGSSKGSADKTKMLNEQ